MMPASTMFKQTKERIVLPLQDFWQQCQPRERTMLSCALAVVFLALFYLLLIDPALSGRLRLQKSLPALRQQAGELQLLISRATTLSVPPLQTIAPIDKKTIEDTLKHKGLIAKSVTVSGDFAKIQMSDVAFTGLLDWLNEAQKTAHWQVTDATISAQSGLGLVNASITLWQQQNESQ